MNSSRHIHEHDLCMTSLTYWEAVSRLELRVHSRQPSHDHVPVGTEKDDTDPKHRMAELILALESERVHVHRGGVGAIKYPIK